MIGCLFELFVEVFVEGLFELIGCCYIKLMLLIVPEKTITDRTRATIKNIVKVIAVILGIILVIGLILLIQDDPVIKIIGKYATYIPLTIIALQVVLGIITKTVSHIKRK